MNIDSINFWNTKFEDSKYPTDFYLSCIAALEKSSSPEEMAEYIEVLLSWKDAKVKKVITGNYSIDGSNYLLRKTKPNTYNKEWHKSIFRSLEFFNWAKIFSKQEKFDPIFIAMSFS